MKWDNLIHAFEHQVESNPYHLALIDKNELLTYWDVNERANQLAHYLLEQGPLNNVPVAFCLERSSEVLIVMLAILKAGGGYLPLDSAHPKDRLYLILNRSKSPMVITNSSRQDKFAEFPGRLVVLDEIAAQLNEQSSKNLNLSIAADQLAYVIHTSGSTGTPKGVLIEHGSVLNYCQWFAQYSGCLPQQRVDFSSNHIFDMAVTVTLIPLLLGLTVVICEDGIKKDVYAYLNYLNQFQIELIKLTPSYLKVLVEELKSSPVALPHLKYLVIGGENLATAECKAWLEHYPHTILYNEYGPTEITVAATQFPVSINNVDGLGTNVPIGRPGENMWCCILDEKNNALAEGEVGELYIGGAGVARGYLNEVELTQKQFIDASFNHLDTLRWYKTGDLCAKNSDGVFEYMGRIDHQVKIRGFRVDPSEIEKTLSDHPSILSAAVVAQPDNLNEMRLVAYYIVKEQHPEPSFNQLREFLQTYLPDYFIPTAMLRIESFPLNANGKLDRSALPIPNLQQLQHYRPATTVTEEQLVELWEKELGVEQVGVDDNFFELGGHSLAAARIMSQINREDKRISFQDIYLHPTIAALAALIDSTEAQEEALMDVNPLDEHDAIILSDFQLMLWLSHTFEPKAGKLNIVSRKRVRGVVDKPGLEAAFEALIQKQNVLLYQVMRTRPLQQKREEYSFSLAEYDLRLKTPAQREQELEQSLTELRTLYPWPKDAPLIHPRLFYLDEKTAELQIAMPHMISDDASLPILFNELSRFYEGRSPNTMAQESDYLRYVVNEHSYFHHYLDRDISFWSDYLKNASLFPVPEQYVISNMARAKIPYSSYHELAHEDLVQLKNFCAKNRMSIHDALCASLTLALVQSCDLNAQDTPYLYVNIVKSTRDDPDYDDTIGCFLRLEPIKIALEASSTVFELSEQIRQAKMETSFYQRCPSLIKLVSTRTLRQNNNRLVNWLMNSFMNLYSSLSGISEVYHKIFKYSFGRLVAFNRGSHFLVNLNIQNSFIQDMEEESMFLGLKTLPAKAHQYDLLTIDSVLDVCLLADHELNTSYIVVSANLEPEFRQLIAERMMQNLKLEELTSVQ